VVVETAQAVERTYSAAASAGLRVIARIDIVPRDGKPVLVNVFVMAFASDAPYLASDGTAAEAGAKPSAVHISPLTFHPDGMSPYSSATESGTAAAASSTASVIRHAEEGAALGSRSHSEPVTAIASGVSPAIGASTSSEAGGSCPGGKRRRQDKSCGKAVPDAGAGEVVVRICVRDASGARTPEYIALLRELGKPG
jgi:hypothetical protein